MAGYLNIGMLTAVIISSSLLTACSGELANKKKVWVYSGTYYCIDKRGSHWQSVSYDTESRRWLLAGRDTINKIIPNTPDEYKKCMVDLAKNHLDTYKRLTPDMLADHDWYHHYVWTMGKESWADRVKKYGSVEAFIEADKKKNQKKMDEQKRQAKEISNKKEAIFLYTTLKRAGKTDQEIQDILASLNLPINHVISPVDQKKP